MQKRASEILAEFQDQKVIIKHLGPDTMLNGVARYRLQDGL